MRKVTYNIITEFEEEKVYLNLRLKNLKLPQEDIKQITRRVYGFVQNYDFLSFLIDQVTKDKKLDKPTKRLLMLAVYEHLYLDSVPEYAVISEYTNLCHIVNPKAVKFVSYFLNNHLQEMETIRPQYANEIKNTSIIYSHPQWIVKQLMRDYPEEFIEILKANQQIKTVGARVIKNLENPEDFIPTDYPDFVEVKNNVVQTADFKAGNIIIQDFGSYLIGKVVNATHNEVILDLCAAPGNKTRHIADTAKTVVANEINQSRYQLLKENLKNSHPENTHVINCDATNIQEILDALETEKLEVKYDKILIDAPCSGWGVFNSKPESKYYQKPNDIADIIKIQQQILDIAPQLLNDGGEIIYSTCTINKNENEQQVEKFMEKHNFVEINNEREIKYKDKTKTGITLLPNEHNGSGFYMCKMKRK